MFQMFTGNDQAKACFGQRAERSLLFLSQALHPIKEIIRNFNRRLHNMATHTITRWLPISSKDREKLCEG